MQQALDDLVKLLDLESIEVNLFRGRSPDENRQRVFGGQVAGQALVAAARTVEDRSRMVHSLHAYFLRPGDPTVPILYEVDRIRDGRSFTTRRVVGIQHGRAIFNLQASFHVAETGPDHQLPMPAVADPETLPGFKQLMEPYKEQMGDWYDRPRPIDIRYADTDPISRKGTPALGQRVWLRADGRLPDDPTLHACIVTYASDMTLLDTTLLPFGLSFESPGLQMASLDHAMWFHRPFRADEWLLYDQSAISTGAARGLAHGEIYRPDGTLAVTVVQEGLARGVDAKRRSLAIAATMLLSAAVAACSSDDNDSSAPPTAPIVSSPTTSDDGADTTGPASSAAPSTDPATSTAASTSPTTSSTTAPTTAAPTVGPTSPTAVDPNQLAFPAIAEVSHPVDLTYRAGDPAFYIVSRDGFVVALRDGVLDDTRLLDISNSITAGGEQGLLGLTFSVDGQHAYVNYTNGSGDTEITEYAVGGDGVFDPASKRVLLTIDQPYSNHNGGQVRIGPDGFLYIGMGDGGSGGDPERRALNVAELLGKMLRIDPNPAGDSPYGIPADNPFIGVQGARTEIWSVGLRNPWRYTFDRANNDLWIADVGQGEWEEIDVAPAATGGGRGANFGWSAYEGTHRFNEDQSGDGAIPPVHEYQHGSAGCSVSGGVRYRGAAIPDLYGWYVYGDYCNSQVRALEIADDYTAGREVVLSSSINSLSEIAEGPDGELFALSVDDDTVYAIQPAG